jgi:hypothetical protein
VGALPLFASGSPAQRELEQRTRDTAALASFLLTTLLLPAMLTAPADRDLRIVHVVNRWYAAAGPRFFLDNLYSFGEQPTPTSPLLPEASRALRTALFTRHLQRILDALPAPSAVPDPSGAVPAQKKSNIVAVSVSPGLSRVETVGPLFGVGVGGGGNWLGAILYVSFFFFRSRIRIRHFASPFSCLSPLLPLLVFPRFFPPHTDPPRFSYVLLYPLLLLLTKSAAASVQSVLHVLFVPTVGKVRCVPSEYFRLCFSRVWDLIWARREGKERRGSAFLSFPSLCCLVFFHFSSVFVLCPGLGMHIYFPVRKNARDRLLTP